MRSLNKKNFYIAAACSLLIAIALAFFSLYMGKENFFLFLNNDYGKFFDSFFSAATYLGEEGAWILLLVVVLFILKRRDAFLLMVCAVVYSTIITQGLKNFVFPGEPRPTKAITDSSLIHVVQGVQLSTINSFPSGHTSSAFSVFLVLCLLINKKWWLPVGLLYASLVAYSRIYLAQHFPTDVAAGIVVAIISVWLSFKTQEYWWRKRVM